MARREAFEAFDATPLLLYAKDACSRRGARRPTFAFVSKLSQASPERASSLTCNCNRRARGRALRTPPTLAQHRRAAPTPSRAHHKCLVECCCVCWSRWSLVLSFMPKRASRVLRRLRAEAKSKAASLAKQDEDHWWHVRAGSAAQHPAEPRLLQATITVFRPQDISVTSLRTNGLRGSPVEYFTCLSVQR